VQNKKSEDVKNLVKILYDLEQFQINGRNEIPAQLLIEQLDEEQIWQQIELKVKFTDAKSNPKVSPLISH
jgi:U3 small nucleolar ribonucleoprotein component